MSDSTQAPFFIDNEVIRLTQNGVWLADGIEITHEGTQKLFAKSLKKDGQGYYLQVGRETKRIEVEDTAYFVVRVDGDPLNGFKVLINDERQEALNPYTLKYRPGRLSCMIARAENLEEAKFQRAAYFDFLQNLREDGACYFLEIQKQKMILARK